MYMYAACRGLPKGQNPGRPHLFTLFSLGQELVMLLVSPVVMWPGRFAAGASWVEAGLIALIVCGIALFLWVYRPGAR